MFICRFQRLPPARGGTAQKKIINLANWSQLIHPGPASSLTKVFFDVESVMRVKADSLLIRAAATSTLGTLNDLTTDLIMANNNNMFICRVFIYDTLIAGGGWTLFPFVVHLQDVWMRVNGTIFWQMLGLTVNNGFSTTINTPYEPQYHWCCV